MNPTLDEVIAANVRRLRQDHGLSVVDLADAIEVGRHAVYDYERPRRGKQHAFLWSELVELCAALECSLFELVLPPTGVGIDLPRWVAHGPREARRTQKVVGRETQKVVGWITKLPTRTELSWLLFQFDVETLEDRVRAKWVRDEAERLRTEARAVAEEVYKLAELAGRKPDFVYDPAFNDEERIDE